MKIQIIKSAIEMLNKLVDLAHKVIEAQDPEKYTKAVDTLHGGVGDAFKMMREIIEKDTTLSVDEKLEKLKKLAEDEEAAKKRCGEAIEGHSEKVAKVSLDVLKGFLTCGLSFTPAIAKSVKNALSKGEDIPLIDAAEEAEINDLQEEVSEET